MSVDVLSNAVLPTFKRSRLSSSPIRNSNVSKCGEVFVSDCAKIWTFNCNYCQLSTTDIGIFICHIRLDHLIEQTTALATQQCSNTALTIATTRQNVENITTAPAVTSSRQIQSEIITDEPLQLKDNEAVEVFYISNVGNDVGDEELTLTAEEGEDNNENNDEDQNVHDYMISANVKNSLLNELKCKDCCTIFDNITALNMHTNMHCSQNNYKKHPYHCVICDKGFISKYGMLNHSRQHQKNNLKQCPVCKTSIYCKYYATHVLTHENDTRFPCQVCGTIYDSQIKRLKHWRTHKEEFPFDCSYCFRRFKKEQYFIKHQKMHKPLQCKRCTVEFFSKHALRRRPPSVCENCTIIVAQKSKEQEQQEETNEEIITGDNNNRECNEIITGDNSNESPTQNIEKDEEEDSDESSDSDVVLANLLPEHVKRNRAHQCQYCYKICKRESSLNYHISKRHTKNHKSFKHKCNICQRLFQSKAGQVFHEKTHNTNNKFQCPVCPHTEFRENFFISHVLKHQNDSCYPCQVCAQIFNTDAERLEHWQTHAAERPHICNICYRRYPKYFILKNHLRIHGIYDCQLCGENFKSSQILRQPYVCEKCINVPDNNVKAVVSEHQSRTLASSEDVATSNEEEKY